MKLTLKDRVLILNSVLPLYDNRANMKLKASIVQKIDITSEESTKLIINQLGNGQVEIALKDPERNISVWATDVEYSLSNEEMRYLKDRVEFIDKNGMFSVENMDSYDKILDEPIQSTDSSELEEG